VCEILYLFTNILICSGRKANCVMFGVLYSVACLTKLVNNYWILMLGRLVSGIATSILFSAFEAWMVHQHHAVCDFVGETCLLTDSCASLMHGLGIHSHCPQL